MISPKKPLRFPILSIYLCSFILCQTGIAHAEPIDQEEETIAREIETTIEQPASPPEYQELIETKADPDFGKRTDTNELNNEEPPTPQEAPQRYINEIFIVGNTFTSEDAIRNYIPYKEGEVFNAQKSSQLIQNLYHGLKRFHNITLKGSIVGNDQVDLYVIVEEKRPLKDVSFVGNNNLTEKEMAKKIDFNVPAVDAQELKVFSEQIKKLYFDKGYQNVSITTDLTIDEDGKSIATFTIDEGSKSRIRRIMFQGNEHISEKDLRNTVLTKEEWILSLVDKTGSFHPERLEADKHMIEQHYQNEGFMQAKVYDVLVEPEPDTNILNLTFLIDEGPQYKISEITASGNDILPEAFLLANIPIRVGNLYSREAITNAIKRLEMIWGNMGYIFASIEPSIQPNEETKTVALSFASDLGKKIKLNRITIKGNKKTRDKVIRRRLGLQEGSMLSQSAMDGSKNNIMSLGYFEPQDGVNWKLRRLNENEADLDLILKESKTGHANVQMGFGGSGIPMSSPTTGFNVKGSVADTNLFGSGMAINLDASWAKEEQTLNFHLAQPWLFDKPLSGAMDIFHRRPSYDQLKNVASAITSKITGGALTAGFISPAAWKIMNNTQMLGTIGIDSVRYSQVRVAINGDIPKGITRNAATEDYISILSKEFVPGDYLWFAWNIEQDKRNHPMHANRGQKWRLIPKIAVPSFDRGISKVKNEDGSSSTKHEQIGYGKLYFDYAWYTPIINEYDLVFKLHLFFGIAAPIKNKTIPFGELFHIGGDTTVRGFTYGQIGPKFLGDTIGAKKAFYMNAELVAPITNDMAMKAVFFYDGGAGWDNPYVSCVNSALVTDNSFNYRHSVGVGLRMLRPMPVRIDWGFKLDPREGESASEVHFGMSYDW